METGTRMGILAFVSNLHGMEGGEFGEDYAVSSAAAVHDSLLRVCQSIHGDRAAVELKSFSSKLLGLVGDQAVQKTLRILKERFFHSVVLISRDPAHAVRIAMKEPLRREDKNSEIFEMLFDGDHALLKDTPECLRGA